MHAAAVEHGDGRGEADPNRIVFGVVIGDDEVWLAQVMIDETAA